MKKYFSIIPVAVIVLISFSAKAQVSPVKSYIGLYGGLSNSLNDFGKSDYDNNKAGFAKRGSAYSIDAAIYFYKNLAVGANVSFQDQGELNSIDANTLAVGYTNSFKSNGTTVSAVNRYHAFTFMLGPQYSFVIKKFIIDLRVSAGLLRSTSTPEISIYLSDVPGQTTSIVQESSAGKALVYGGNLNLRYSLGQSWFVALKGTYLESPGLNINTTGRTLNVGRLVTKQPITEFQTTIGIIHSF